VRDMVVKDQDLVLGTHGRGFWILDDIAPLRQVTPQLLAAGEAVLFPPTDPIRGVYDGIVQYYLPKIIDSVTIEILDAEGKVVDTFVGKEPKYKPDPNLPWWQRGGSSVPTTAAGVNDFTWDLRYPGATTFDGMIIWSARPASGPKAPPGTYQVRLTAGSYTKTHSFTILMDPNLKGISGKDLEEQFELAMKIRDKTSAANQAVIRIREVRAAVDDRLAKVDEGPLTQSAKAMLAKLSAIEEELYQVKNQSGQDPLNFPIKLNNRLAYLRRSLERGDAKPTDGARKVFGELSADLAGHLKQLNEILDAELPKLNQSFTEKGLKGVER